jgi:hypothetical protein
MQTTTTCSWCHHLNDAGQRSCDNCGHDSNVPRTQCRCSACTVAIPLGNSGHAVTLLAPDSVRHRERTRLRVVGAPAGKIEHLQAGMVVQYVIYHGLTNWPGKYVVRALNGTSMDGGPIFYGNHPLAIAEDLAAVRRVIPKGYVNIGRNTKDPACIVEIWL